MSTDDLGTVASATRGAAESEGHFGVGSVVGGRYEVLRLLGEGAMGTVYCVRDRDLDEVVALKTLRVELAHAAEALARFRREVKLARRVTHPNVARTFDLGHHDGVRYLTMEFVEGRSLSSHANHARLPIVEVLRIAEEVGRGLVAAHAAGVIHRDLKPDNVMIAESRVIITDFGIARLDAPDDIRMTQGRIVGTPAYMAPEQVDGRPVDGRADVYAFGAMLFELLTHRIPHDGPTALAIAAAKLMRPAPDPREFEPTLPDGVASLIVRMLAREKEDRPDSSQALASIERLRGGGDNAALNATHVAVSLAPRRAVDAFVSASMRRVGLAAFDADAPVETLARDLERAILDAGPRLRMDLDRASTTSVRDAWTLTGEVRVSGTRLRARLRLLPPGTETPSWTERVEGSLDDVFSFEDAVLEAVARSSNATRASATELVAEPIRDRYNQARSLLLSYTRSGTEDAVKMCELIEQERPDDPVVWSLHAAALARAWQFGGSVDDALIVKAEELALRALDRSPNLPEAYLAVAKVRGSRGDNIASIRAGEECVRRSPLHAEAHLLVGDLLGQAGEALEGIHRIELGLRLNPELAHGYHERGRLLALLGNKEEALASVHEAIRRGSGVGYAIMNRFCVWWGDRELATWLADKLESDRRGAIYEATIPSLRALAQGDYLPAAEETFDRVTRATRGPGFRNMLHAVAAEYFARFDRREESTKYIARLGDSGFVDLLWADRCPALDSVRGSPIFAEARAKIAGRAAEVLRI